MIFSMYKIGVFLIEILYGVFNVFYKKKEREEKMKLQKLSEE